MTAENLASRMARLQAAINLEKGDRVPVSLMMAAPMPGRYKGMTQGELYRNPAKAQQAIFEVFDELGGYDAAPAGANTCRDENVLDAPMRIKVPGRDLPEDAPIQWDEAEVLTHADYDRIIEHGWKDFMYDFYPRFRGWDTADYHTRIEARAARDIEQRRAVMKVWEDKEIPVYQVSYVNTPLMMLSTCRSFVKFTMDLHRIPDKVEATMDAMIDDLIETSIKSVKDMGVSAPAGIPAKSLVMERGGAFYYPLRIFERFEWPYTKKLVEALIAEGIMPILHFDQDWTLNLPYLRELPRGSCVCQFDSCTDIFKAKEILGDHLCIMGDVPPSLLSLGAPEEVEEYCKKLIDVVGEGGGFILGVGCTVPVQAKFENLKAMIDTAKSYRPPRSV
jgi:hypothetical protein